jgi:flavin reductase (DIM6/NTAB) family NADH-FMN oxidoreductase RutF
VTDESFEDFMMMIDGPAFVVTTQVDGYPSGCLVSFATRTSVRPPSFMIGMPAGSHTVEFAGQSEYLAVHLLPAHQHALAELFGRQTPDQVDKFARCSWRGGPAGMPILDEAVGWMVGRTVSRSEVGDHVAYLLQPVAVWVPESAEELLYLSDLDDDLDPGHDPGHESSQRLHGGDGRRYGLRFTLDLP